MAYKDSTVVGRDSRKPIYYLELSAGKMESKMETKWKKILYFRMHFQKDESKIEKNVKIPSNARTCFDELYVSATFGSVLRL